MPVAARLVLRARLAGAWRPRRHHERPRRDREGLAGNKGPPPPEAKAPQITPMGQDTMKAGIAQGSQQALQGILSSPSLIDPRKRQQGLA